MIEYYQYDRINDPELRSEYSNHDEDYKNKR